MKSPGLYTGLMKIPLSLLISLSAIFGFLLKNDQPDGSIFLTGIAIFFLACGGAVLNNYQDREIDCRFSRTRHRALPSGRLPPHRALKISVVLIIAGIITLYLIRFDCILPLMGIAAILLYNGIYTPLKIRSVFAILPGALCGMLPPLIGWMAAGGDTLSLKIFSVMVMFGLWQFPHFWLILLNHSSEYRLSKQPNMLNRFNRFQLEKIVFIWIANFSVMLALVPVLYWGFQPAWGWIFALTGLLLTGTAAFTLFFKPDQKKYHSMFTFLNGTVLFAMLFVIFECLT